MPFHLLPRRRSEPATIPPPPLPRAVQLVHPVAAIGIEETLWKAIHRFRAERVAALPVVSGTVLVGWISEQRVAELLLDGRHDPDRLLVAEAFVPAPALVEPLALPAEIAALMRERGQEMLPVVFSDGRYEGCVLLADVLAVMAGRLAPPRIGGMATPLGVYLTSGVVSGGVGAFGLLLAGALMASMLWLLQIALIYGLDALYAATQMPFFTLVAGVLIESPAAASPSMEILAFVAAMTLVMGGFLLLLRFGPLMAGFHAAEHQTVNAIEAGEPLTPEAVGKMSRVHPRCGTNLWGFMAVTYLGVAILSMLLSTQFGRDNLTLVMVFVLWYILGVVMNWKRIGGWLQAHLTTRRATPREIASGIRAGEEVLRRHLTMGMHAPRTWQRIWHMGLAQVLIGAITATYLLDWALDFLVYYLLK